MRFNDCDEPMNPCYSVKPILSLKSCLHLNELLIKSAIPKRLNHNKTIFAVFLLLVITEKRLNGQKNIHNNEKTLITRLFRQRLALKYQVCFCVV